MATFSRLFHVFVLLATFFGMGVADLPLEMLQGVHKKFEFKYSFKAPMLVNSKGEVPFWDRGGDAIPTEVQIRVCPSIQDRRGWLWTKNVFDKDHWMMDVEFSITGKHTYGADGMAFWFTANKGYGGSMFGSVENFEGLAVVIDTFDNNGLGDSPKIGVYIGNGTFHYDQGSDGLSKDAGHCLKFVRNKRHNPKIKIVYYEKKLEVWIHDGDSDQPDAYESCVTLEGINLPSKGYFGVSAATGGLSDDHDVTSFLVHSLVPGSEHRQKMIEKMDKKRAEELQDQYSKMSETFDTKRKQYRKEHDKDEMEWERRMEVEENIQLIYDMQNAIHKNVRDIANQVNKQMSGGGGTGGGISDSTLLAAEGRLTHHIQELRSQLETGNLNTGGNNNLPASEQMQPLYEMKELVKQLILRVDELQNQVQGNSDSRNCPPANSTCLTTWFFILAMCVQSGIVVIFLLYKQSQERNAKKFF